MQPIIMLVDMNSYFASCEQQDNLAWRGKPVGVCEHLGGIIIAPSVEAKRWGIKTGTPVWEAKRLYPKIILTETHADRYRFYTRRLIKVLQDYTDRVEVASIDEVYVDLTKACNIRKPAYQLESLSAYKLVDPFMEAERIAREIKQRMKVEVGDWLRCSIGIGANKLVAKIASDLQKPNGLVVITNSKFEIQNSKQYTSPKANSNSQTLYLTKHDLYFRLKLTDIPGIGHRQEKNLNELGIKTLLDLKNYPLSKLVAHFGLPGYHLYHMGQLEGSWKADVEHEDEIKSIGHMYTLPKEYRTREFFEPVLYKLSEMVARRCRKQELWGNVLHFYVTDKHHGGFGRSQKLGRYIDDGREIFLEARRIFRSFNIQEFNFKMIGITLAGLKERTSQQSLFGVEEKIKRVDDALDKIDEKYGDFTVTRLTAKLAGKVFRDSIGFGRIKENGHLFSARGFGK